MLYSDCNIFNQGETISDLMDFIKHMHQVTHIQAGTILFLVRSTCQTMIQLDLTKNAHKVCQVHS